MLAVCEERVSVNMGEIRVSRDPRQLLVAYGLGSCICVCAYDPALKLGGMLHALIPERQNGQPVSAKFADVGVKMLIEELETKGALRQRLIVKLAGGAQVLAVPGMTGRFDIGARNAEAALNALSQLGVRPIAKDIGGNMGRTVLMQIHDGKVTVRFTNGSLREL